MDFLEKLYSNENFGIYLFVIIASLIILFFVILFFGKKDQKKEENVNKIEENNNEENKVIEQANTDTNVVMEPVSLDTLNPPVNNNVEQINNAFKEVSSEVLLDAKPQEEIEAKEVVQPVVQPAVQPTFNNNVLNSELSEESILTPPIKEDDKTIIAPEKEFDFDALADAISKELDSIKINKSGEEEVVKQPINETKVVNENKPVIEEKEFSFPTFENVVPDNIPSDLFEPVKKEEKKEELPKPVMPSVFSSVYVNRNEEQMPKKEVTVEPSESAVPFELPKMADLPKKVEKVEPKETFSVNNVLNGTEDERYKIR